MWIFNFKLNKFIDIKETLNRLSQQRYCDQEDLVEDQKQPHFFKSINY